VKSVQKSSAVKFTNGPTCAGIEYSFDDKDLNIAVVTVNGRYPETGYVTNDVCKEAGLVLGGSGKLCLENGVTTSVQMGDAVLIQPGEKYFWEGESLEMMMPCSPAFYPEQHQAIQ
jgi:hypothetical protein